MSDIAVPGGRLTGGRRTSPKALLRVAAAGILVLLFVNSPSRATDHETVEGLTQEAEEIAASVLEAYPQDPDSHALVGWLRSLQGNTEEAERSWERCLELDPKRADIHESLAKAAWDRGDFEKAATAYRQASRIDPTMPGIQVRLGRSLLELGRIDEAVVVMEQAVSSTGLGHYYLAQAYMQSKAYEKARDSYRRAVDNRPDNAQAYYGLAQASIRLGQPDKAKQYQERFQKLSVEDPESVKAQKRKQLSGLARERDITAGTCAGAAKIYRSHGDLRQAERLMQRAADIAPHNFGPRKTK